jgi:hypothetical protein
MNTHEAKGSTHEDPVGLFFSPALLPPRVQGWVLLIIGVLMFIDGIRLLLQR